MIEKKLQKKLRGAVLQVSILFLVLLVGGGLLFSHLQGLQDAAVREQVIAEAEEYKTRILKQLQSDFQALSTLAAFLEEPENEEGWDRMARQLQAANESSDFLSMAFYGQELRGIICTPGQEPLVNAALSGLDQQAQQAVTLALDGAPSVSRLFQSTISQQRVFAYSIPIYEGGEVVGALSATDHIDIFSDILSGNTVLGGGGYIHLIGSDGSFLVRSPNTVVQTNPNTIYDGPYLSDSSDQEVQAAMQAQERIFSSFTYEGRSYPFLLEPVGLNGWYLFCVNTGEGLASASADSSLTIGVLFALVLLLVLFLMVRGYRLLRNYSQDLRRLAYYDPLTGAENAVRFHQRLVEALGAGGDPEAAADHLLTSVLFALDRARGGHTSTIWFFDTELHKKEELENDIESHMHQALLDGEFQMFLQPKKDLRSGELAGAEALVRWRTSDGRMIFPDQFIPLFERNGFCARLDLYMAEQACRRIRSWMDRGIAPIPLSVNQSKRLFFEPDYVQSLTDLARAYGIPPRFITLEILEGLALENVDALNEKIGQLQAVGFRISLDDFGSGFSSLNTLGKLRIDELKLDRGFLLGVSSREQDRVRLILKEIVQIARQLSISTVAEGVETAEDERLIREVGCDLGQGYLYGRPVSADAFDAAFMQSPPPRRLEGNGA